MAGTDEHVFRKILARFWYTAIAGLGTTRNGARRGAGFWRRRRILVFLDADIAFEAGAGFAGHATIIMGAIR
jgi:hypothetical protein